MQESAAEFLAVLLARVPLRALAQVYARFIRAALLDALALAVTKAARASEGSFRPLVLQVSLLRLLRLVVEVEHASTPPSGSSSSLTASALDDPDGVAGPKFLQTLIMGLLQSHPAFNVRVYWLEFITHAMPLLYADLEAIVVPVASCLSDLLTDLARHSQRSSVVAAQKTRRFHFMHAQEATALLAALRHILAYVLFGVRPGLPATAEGEVLTEQGFVDVPRDETASAVPHLVAFMKDLGGFFAAPFAPAQRQTLSATATAVSTPSPGPLPLPPSPPSSQASAALVKQLPTISASLSELWEAVKLVHVDSDPSEGVHVAASPPLYDDVAHIQRVLRDALVAILDPLFKAYPSTILKGLLRDWKFVERSAWVELTDDNVRAGTADDYRHEESALALLHALPSFNLALFFTGAKTLVADIRDRPTEHVHPFPSRSCLLLWLILF